VADLLYWLKLRPDELAGNVQGFKPTRIQAPNYPIEQFWHLALIGFNRVNDTPENSGGLCDRPD
jgi:hypothetical protein